MSSERIVPIPITAAASHAQELAMGGDVCDECSKKQTLKLGDIELAQHDGEWYTHRSEEDIPNGIYTVEGFRGYNERTKKVAEHLDLFVIYEERGFRYWLKVPSSSKVGKQCARAAQNGELVGYRLGMNEDGEKAG